MSEKERRPGRGRPAAGVVVDGSAERVSDYPKLTVSMRPETKVKLEAYSTLVREPAWRVVDEALRLFLDAIPAEDKFAVEGMAKRMQTRAGTVRRRTVA
jgi:hypothetical protein